MLAQNFKTAADLDISKAEVDALIKVLGMLERGELEHHPSNQPDTPNGFNMGHWGAQTDCGSIGCIKGWAQFSGLHVFWFVERYSPVEGLFQVDNIHLRPWTEITASEAACALRNFLTLGEARWAEVLSHSTDNGT